MENRGKGEKKQNRLLWVDLGVTVFVLSCFWSAKKEAERWLSFAGFGALFMILVYSVFIGILLLGGVCLALSIRRRQWGFLVAGSVCQGLVVLGWFGLWTAIPSLWTWTETGCAALGAVAVLALLRGKSSSGRGTGRKMKGRTYFNKKGAHSPL